jgi:hypothetical protein
MKKLLSSLAIISTISLSVSGCASLFGDNNRQITVKSQPSGANIYVDGINYGTTPSVISLPTYVWNGQPIIVKKSGFQDTGVLINSKFQNVGLLNILFFPGFLVDAATGNTMKIDPNRLNVEVNMTANNQQLHQARN